MTHSINGRYVTPAERDTMLNLRGTPKPVHVLIRKQTILVGHITKGHAQGIDLFEAMRLNGDTTTYIKESNAISWLQI